MRLGFDYDGDFTDLREYSIGEAVNPCLNIGGLGSIGLPLSARDAVAIINTCDEARFGEGETRIKVEDNGEGCWRLDTTKVNAFVGL